MKVNCWAVSKVATSSHCSSDLQLQRQRVISRRGDGAIVMEVERMMTDRSASIMTTSHKLTDTRLLLFPAPLCVCSVKADDDG